MELTGALLTTIALCVASAAAYAAAAVWQQRLAHRSMASLTGSRAWWAALALNGVGAVLHVFALRYGSLSLVQPFGILTLVLAVPFAAATHRRRVTDAEWRGMAASGAGLLGILLLTGADAGAAALTTAQLVSVLSTAVVALTVLAIRGAVPGASGLWAAAAGGIAFGVSSAMS